MAQTPWKPTRSTVIAIGLLSLWPFIYMCLFFAMFAFTFVSFQQQSDEVPVLFKFIFPLHCGTMLLMFGLVGVYIFHLFRTDRIAQDKKALWAVVLFLGNILAFPIYWYLYMWRQADESSGQPRDDSVATGGG